MLCPLPIPRLPDRRPTTATACILVAALLVAAGCHREDVAVYEAPKDAPAAPPPAAAVPNPHGGAGEQLPPRPGLSWKSLPGGWTSKGASGMRVANFLVEAAGVGSADLAVIPLPGTGGSDLDLVNLWRSQLALPPITEPDLAAHTEEVSVRGETVRLFSIVGTGSTDASAAANQILVAALRRDGFTWFFKLAGEAKAVAAQRENLKSFLAEVQFTAPTAGPSGMAASAVEPPADSDPSRPSPSWTVPGEWKAVPPTQMIHSKWTFRGGGASSGADITVSVFPGETGGLVANLNRWRSQVGLPPAEEKELSPLIDAFDVDGGKATLVDFSGSSPESGSPVRMVAAVVRRDGKVWFYKMLGSASAVEAGRSGFVQFVQTAKYTPGA